MRHRLTVTLILAGALAAPAALAQPKPDAPRPDTSKDDASKPDASKSDKPPKSEAQKAEEARLAKLAEARLADLVKRGTEACDRGELEDGLTALSAAYTQKADADVASALASCEMKAKRWGGAADHLTAALRQKEEGPERTALEKRLTEAQKHAGALQITVNIEGADVFVGDRFAGQTPLSGPVFADAGKPTLVVAKKTGYEEAQRTVEVAAGRAISFKMDLVPESGDPNRYAYARRTKVPFFVLGGAALVAAGVGGALYAAANTKGAAADDLLAALPGGTSPCANTKATGCPTVLSLRQGHDKLMNIGTGVLAGGGALLVAAAITGVWAFSTSSRASGSVPAATRTATLAPAVSSDGAGLWLTGSF